ncbi:MAG: phenylacetate--CoA ligase family protein, partial [Acidimicrobiia bacterium]|nr:phenylacetate--CoA ligase family protein [Acidimicrobiia bacterium]
MKLEDLGAFTETLGRAALTEIQLRRLQLMLGVVLDRNRFYTRKLGDSGLSRPEQLRSFDDLRQLPFTTKQELASDQLSNRPYGTNLTFATETYTKIHQTSGTTGEPLRCLDTDDSWRWWAECWASVYRAVGVTAIDRIFFAFSFGPFIGFWSGYDGARLIGALTFPGGGMSSVQRARAIAVNDISVLVCTPTYALHLAEVAEQEGIDLAASNVRVTIHAGEPGASIPSTKARIEKVWGARCYDHVGATEVGAWGFECKEQAGVHVNEGEFIAEVIDPKTGQPTDDGELVITNLGRIGMPVIRYRTGDRVKLAAEPCRCGRTFARFEGGVIGRVDDVLIVRGVNVYPSAIENLIRQVPEVGEFAVDVYRLEEMDQLDVRIEVPSGDGDSAAAEVGKQIHTALGIRAQVTSVPVGT